MEVFLFLRSVVWSLTSPRGGSNLKKSPSTILGVNKRLLVVLKHQFF